MHKLMITESGLRLHKMKNRYVKKKKISRWTEW